MGRLLMALIRIPLKFCGTKKNVQGHERKKKTIAFGAQVIQRILKSGKIFLT